MTILQTGRILAQVAPAVAALAVGARPLIVRSEGKGNVE